jgi:hypothetical protein
MFVYCFFLEDVVRRITIVIQVLSSVVLRVWLLRVFHHRNKIVIFVFLLIRYNWYLYGVNIFSAHTYNSKTLPNLMRHNWQLISAEETNGRDESYPG